MVLKMHQWNLHHSPTRIFLEFSKKLSGTSKKIFFFDSSQSLLQNPLGCILSQARPKKKTKMVPSPLNSHILEGLEVRVGRTVFFKIGKILFFVEKRYPSGFLMMLHPVLPLKLCKIGKIVSLKWLNSNVNRSNRRNGFSKKYNFSNFTQHLP